MKSGNCATLSARRGFGSLTEKNECGCWRVRFVGTDGSLHASGPPRVLCWCVFCAVRTRGDKAKQYSHCWFGAPLLSTTALTSSCVSMFVCSYFFLPSSADTHTCPVCVLSRLRRSAKRYRTFCLRTRFWCILPIWHHGGLSARWYRSLCIEISCIHLAYHRVDVMERSAKYRFSRNENKRSATKPSWSSTPTTGCTASLWDNADDARQFSAAHTVWYVVFCSVQYARSHHQSEPLTFI